MEALDYRACGTGYSRYRCCVCARTQNSALYSDAAGLPGGGWRQEENALYVANLPYDSTAADLYTIFASFGAIPPRGVKVTPSNLRMHSFANGRPILLNDLFASHGRCIDLLFFINPFTCTTKCPHQLGMQLVPHKFQIGTKQLRSLLRKR